MVRPERMLGVLIALSLGGCNDVVPPAPIVPAPTSRTNLEVAASDERGPEQHLQELARVAPQFAGVYVSDVDELTVLMVSDSQKSDVDARVRQIFARGGRRTKRGPLNVRYLPATYKFTQLAAWRDRVLDALYGVSDWTGVSIRSAKNKVVVYLRPGVARNQFAAILSANGIPDGAYEFIDRPGARPNVNPTLHSRMRPLRGGVAIGPSGCTLGPIAFWGPYAVGLTASHCTEQDWYRDPSDLWMTQPQFSIATWGRELFDFQGFKCHFLWLDRCRRADVAAYSLASVDLLPGESDRYALGQIARPVNRVDGTMGVFGSTTIDDTDPLNVVAVDESVFEGEDIDKIGVTTGWTHGPVVDVCVTVQKEGSPHGRFFNCQVTADYHTRPGDSGGPVFRYNFGSSVTLLGINHGDAGNPITGIFSPMGQIRLEMSQFPLTFYTAPPGPSSYVNIYGPTSIRPGAQCHWTLGTNVEAPSIEWRVDEEPLGDQPDFYYNSEGSFVLGATVWNTSVGAWASTAISVAVSSQAPECYEM